MSADDFDACVDVDLPLAVDAKCVEVDLFSSVNTVLALVA